MSETPRTEKIWNENRLKSTSFKLGTMKLHAEQLEKELTALQSENAKLKADIAAKDAILQKCDDALGHLSRFGYAPNQDRLQNEITDALSPNPPVYVPVDVVEKLVEALGDLIKQSPNDHPEDLDSGRCPHCLAYENANEALALARPFITKGEKHE